MVLIPDSTMKMRNLLLSALVGLSSLAATAAAATPDLFALRVGKAETVSGETIEHAVILIENGRIVTIGQDLEIERGIPVIDRPDWVATPGFVNPYSRVGMDSRGGSGTKPSVQASTELYPSQGIYAAALETGVVAMGLYPPGNGIPGQAVVVSTAGTTREDMVLREGAYLKVLMQSNNKSKKAIRDGFEKADEHLAEVEEAREKHEEAVEKFEKDEKAWKKLDDDEKAKKKEPVDPGDFQEPEPDAVAGPFLDLRSGDLSAMFSIRKAGDYLHLLDALGDEELPSWSLRVPLRNDIDLYEIADHLEGRHVVVEPRLTLMPWTMRERNLPAELDRAGAHVAFIPNSDSLSGHEAWRLNVGHLVKRGMEHHAALRAMTLGPAEVLGITDELGSLDVGKRATMLFFDGDPFQPSTNLEAVMVDGDFLDDGAAR